MTLQGASLEPHALCIVMEYAPGGSLFSFLRHRAHELDAQRTLNWAIDVACGMKYLCEEAPTPIVHRDLKSHNLLIAGNGRLKISDFGVARVAATQAGMMSSTAGTFAYMAVECITQREYSQKSDVWSFGVVLWELITGQVPYDLIEPFAVAYGVATGQLRLPVPAGCPPVYRGLIEACWARDPSARPTFAQLQRRLEEDDVLESEGQRASLPSLRDQWSPEMTSRLDDIHQWELSLRDKEQELLCFKDELLQREASLSKREENMRLYERVYELNRAELNDLRRPMLMHPSLQGERRRRRRSRPYRRCRHRLTCARTAPHRG